jgi:hypothetical protein
MVNRLRTLRRAAASVAGMCAFVLAASSASAETLAMPNRDFLMGASEVVWGITTLDNDGTGGIATTYEFDFDGDGVFDAAGTVTDRSYIAVNHTFPLAGTFTVGLRVTRGATVEDATTEVNVYDGAALNATDLRNLNVNRAIANGLRYLWTSQINRAANFPAGTTTSWGGSNQFDFPAAFTSLVVLAFENHGYQVPNNNSVPTGIYQKYVVLRGLNFVLSELAATNLTMQGAGDPCAGGFGPAPCQGLELDESGHGVYETGLAVLPLAASGALSRQATVGLAGLVNGETYEAILQRLVNSIAWGQGDNVGNGQGGWHYDLNNQGAGDGSSEGWIMLALLDAESAGATVPNFVRTEWSAPATGGLARGLNTDGSFDYQHNSNAASNSAVNVAKTGVGLQGMYFAGIPVADPRAQSALDWINTRWHAPSGESFLCSGSLNNKGCGYAMFNVFKALKLHGVVTLPNVNRPAGSLGDLDDWHLDYTDWLLANQTTPTIPTGGNWTPLHFSSQRTNAESPEAALALLILAPTALVLPDPTTFATVGLQHGSPLTTDPVTNPVGTSHTVTAIATAASGAPVATATVNFSVISGPNAGKNGSDVTDGLGQATFTYADTGGPGTDEIRASIGQLQSNIVEKIWVLGVTACDVDANDVVDMADLLAIRAGFGQAAGPNDPRDGNGDGVINIADLRYCQLRLGPVVQ